MTATIHVPDPLYERVQRIAHQQQKNVNQVITELLAEALAHAESDSAFINRSALDPDVEREMQAYLALHPILVKHYLGKHVAIYQGQLVDYDDSFSDLVARVEKQYPDQFVWLTQVEPEPIRTIVHRSPRYDRRRK